MARIKRQRTTTSEAIATLVAAAAVVVAFAAVSVSSSAPGFPGTIQPPPYQSKEFTSKGEDPKANKGSPQSSDDEAGEGESSSDWDDALIMEEDPLTFVVDHVDTIHSLSSDGDNEIESEPDTKSMARGEREMPKNKKEIDETPVTITGKPKAKNLAVPPPPPPPPLKDKVESTQHQENTERESAMHKEASQSSSNHSSEVHSREVQSSDGTDQRQEMKSREKESGANVTDKETVVNQPPRQGHRDQQNSKDHHRHPSNKKPLQTLEKLQQLLDNTDYLTSSSQKHHHQQQELPSQNPNQSREQQQPTQRSKSAFKSPISGINSLWTSKDRTKYKKQQRLQKEQIRLKQQQEEQLRMKQKQNQQQQQIQSVSIETEELSDTDDGLGYTLPNLPVYLSDGEDDTDELLFLPDPTGSVTPESSPSSTTSRSQQKQKSQKQKQAISFAQKQYMQQQRDFLQQQQQQQSQQQHPYYGAGPYPPPPPMGFYPYGPPPPQYYPQQYHPSSYYPYRAVPRVEETVPKNPRQMATKSTPRETGEVNRLEESNTQGEQQSSTEQDSVKSIEGEESVDEASSTQGGIVYPSFDASYYPQTPELQEQWHLQQLSILQAREKYERNLRRKHRKMVMVANLRSFAAATRVTIGSVRKLSTCLALVVATCYAAVSPRNLPYLEYNRRFYENLVTVALVVIPPMVGYGWLIIDWNQLKIQFGKVASTVPSPLQRSVSAPLTNNEEISHAIDGNTGSDGDSETKIKTTESGSLLGAIHALTHSFYSSFVFGYAWVFALEIAWTTILRLGLFLAWEPDMFGVKLPWSSTPASAFEGISEAPPNFLILPWVLREYKYRPKRITLLAADILTSCIACPIVEEFAKLRLLQWTMPLSKNFSWVQKSSKHKKKKIAQPIEASTDETGAKSRDGAVININPYIAGMLAVSLGIKWADAIRRVCMYTKVQDEQKNIYAFLRGIFPVQEMCGIMTALGLARRDVLGLNMPLWRILLPAVIVHSMANLRGMKPIFKWNSSTPWAEMQITPDLFPGLFSESTLTAMDAPLPPTTKLQWFGRAFPKILWVIILGRAAGYCAKNYFMINRQAVRRATTYAGNYAAFSAELEATKQLKNTKDQYN